MKQFIGTYECRADAKGRIMTPMALKKQLLENEEVCSFILKRSVFNTCLELYAMEGWEELMGKVNKLNRFNKKNSDFIRRFTAGVKMVDIDTSGRLLIPKDLMIYGGIGKDVVLTSVGNVIEVWDKEKYEEAISEATIDFGALAEEVMGDNNSMADE